MKKTISLLLVAVLLVAFMAPTAFAAEHTGTVTVTYTASGDPFTGFQGYLTYDDKVFELVSVVGLSGGDFIATESINFAMWAVTNNVESATQVMTATFNIKPGATCGTYNFGFSLEDTSNEAIESVNIAVTAPSVTLEHDWVAGETVDATCTVDGYTPYTCSICGKTKQDTITAPGHQWVDATCTAPKTCSVCGATEGEKADHKYVLNASKSTPAGCEDGILYFECSCGAYYTEVDPGTGHDWKDATCTAPKTCSKCGATDGEALGHKYEYKYNDTHHWTVCSVCGDTTEEQPHNFVDNGGEKLECVCGATKDKETTPSATTTPVETKPGAGGDMGDTTPYATFFLMAVAAVMGTAYGFKRKFVK